MCGLGVPGWRPDEFAFGRILRFFFVALEQGPSQLDAVMYAEVSLFSRGAVDEASGLPTINLDRVMPSPRVIPAKLLTTPVIAAPLTTLDQEAIMASERKNREFLSTVDGTKLSSTTQLKVRRAQKELAQCAEYLQFLGGNNRERLILGSTIKLADIH